MNAKQLGLFGQAPAEPQKTISAEEARQREAAQREFKPLRSPIEPPPPGDDDDDDAPEQQQRFQAFVRFHLSNPDVWRLFKHYAAVAHEKRSGRPVGARMIFERIRWFTAVETTSADGFKLSNNHFPYYARLLMHTDARFVNYFETHDARFDASAADIADVAAGRYALDEAGEIIDKRKGTQ